MVNGAPVPLFSGQIAIPEAQLYYYKARVYDPATGRFLQTDPVGRKDDLNLYAYVGGDPVDKNDPTGETNDKSAGSANDGGASRPEKANHQGAVSTVIQFGSTFRSKMGTFGFNVGLGHDKSGFRAVASGSIVGQGKMKIGASEVTGVSVTRSRDQLTAGGVLSTNVTVAGGDEVAGAVTKSVVTSDGLSSTTVTVGMGGGFSVTPDATLTLTSPTLGEMAQKVISDVEHGIFDQILQATTPWQLR